MEVLGPLVDLAPGGQATADLVWSVCRCPGPIVDATAVSCTTQRLEAVRVGRGAHVRGTFGVFATGWAQLREIRAARVLLDVTGRIALAELTR